MIERASIFFTCLLLATPCAAATLNPADPGDAAIIRSHKCNVAQQAQNFSPASGEACARTYASVTQQLQTNTALTSDQRSKVQLARAGLLTAVLASYAKADGAISRRICQRLPELRGILSAYQRGSVADLNKLHETLTSTLDNMQGKCR